MAMQISAATNILDGTFMVAPLVSATAAPKLRERMPAPRNNPDAAAAGLS
jgi:hypothetical protein